MTVNTRTGSFLKKLSVKYNAIPVSLLYLTSVAMILAMAAAAVHYSQYVFSERDSNDVPGWHAWRVLLLIESFFTGINLLILRYRRYSDLRIFISGWSLGWLVIPVVISAWWLVIGLVKSFLDWQFHLSFHCADIASLLFYTTLVMMIGQMIIIISSIAELMMPE